MIHTDNPKTLARREAMRIKYAYLEPEGEYSISDGHIISDFGDIVGQGPRIDLSGYHYKEGNLIITTYEKEIDGQYCQNPKLLYKNCNCAADHKSCLNIFWTCNDCMNCDKRRKLHIMKQIDKRFRYHTSLDENELYTITMDLGDSNSSKLSKRLKYINDKNNQLMWLIKDTDKSKITFLMYGMIGEAAGDERWVQKRITKDGVINMISVRDKYRFLGKWYKKVPDVEFAGMTREEIDELSKVKAVKKIRCGCGCLEADHVIRKTQNAYDFDMYVEPEDHYEADHIKFKKKYIHT